MPLFYFDVRAHNMIIPDEEGVALPDAESAKNEGRLAAREMVAEAVLREEPIDGTTIDIRDQDGMLVHSVPLSSVVII